MYTRYSSLQRADFAQTYSIQADAEPGTAGKFVKKAVSQFILPFAKG